MKDLDVTDRQLVPYTRLTKLEFGQSIEFFKTCFASPPLCDLGMNLRMMSEPPLWRCITVMHSLIHDAINSARSLNPESRFKIESYGVRSEDIQERGEPEDLHALVVYAVVRRTA